MIVYFSKMYQAIPALQELYKRTGGVMITTRLSTLLKVKRNFPDTNIRLVKEYLPKWWPTMQLMHKARVIITGSPNKSFLDRFSGKKIMVFHGTYAYADKNQLKTLQHFDYLFSIGPRMTSYLTTGGYSDKIRESGYLPFMGFNSLREKEKNAFYLKLGISESRKTILYMPRANPNGSWDLMAKKLLAETPREYNLILRPHPSQAVKIHIGRQLDLKNIRKLCRQRGNAVLDLADNQLSDIFNVTDLIICDGASSPEDSLFYKIPIIFVETDLTSKDKLAEDLKKQNLPQHEINKRLSIYECGISMSPTQSAAEKIKEAFNKSQQMAKQQEKYFKWVFGKKSMERQNNAVDFISSFD